MIYLWQKTQYQLVYEMVLALGEKGSFGFFACFLLENPSILCSNNTRYCSLKLYSCSTSYCYSSAFLCNRILFPKGSKPGGFFTIWRAVEKAPMENQSSWDGPFQLFLHRYRAVSQGKGLWLQCPTGCPTSPWLLHGWDVHGDSINTA